MMIPCSSKMKSKTPLKQLGENLEMPQAGAVKTYSGRVIGREAQMHQPRN